MLLQKSGIVVLHYSVPLMSALRRFSALGEYRSTADNGKCEGKSLALSGEIK